MARRRLLTPQDIARHTRRSTQWVRDHAQELGGIQIGKGWRFHPDILAKLTPPCPAPPESLLTSVQTAATASAGEKTGNKKKNADTTRTQPDTEHPLFADDFDRAFPELAQASP